MSSAAVMLGAYLPGDSTTQLKQVPVPEPGHGEVLLRMKASTICGSDIRCIYHQHLGKGPEGYQGVVAGHEPCGQIVRAGPGCRRFARWRSRHRLSHLRLRRLQRLPPRLHDLLHQRTLSARLWLAARWRHGRFSSGRRERPDLAPARAQLRRWRPGGLRLRHRLRRAGKDRHRRQRRRADHRPRPRRAWPPARSAASWAPAISSASMSYRNA